MSVLRTGVLPQLPGREQWTLRRTEDLWLLQWGGLGLAWRCHLFRGSGSCETDGSQSLSEYFGMHLTPCFPMTRMRMERYEAGVTHYSAVT